MSKGKRYETEKKLNYQKVFAVIIAIAVVIMFVVIIKNALSDRKETNKDYKILVEKELVFIEKNEEMIKKYAKIIYNQKINNYDVSYIKNVVNFKLLEEKCKKYKKEEN